MQKSIRSFVLVATVVLASIPAHADRMGTNPRPSPAATSSITQTILNFFGL